MLLDPNLNSPANIDAAVHLKNDPDGWKKKAWSGCWGYYPSLAAKRVPILWLRFQYGSLYKSPQLGNNN